MSKLPISVRIQLILATLGVALVIIPGVVGLIAATIHAFGKSFANIAMKDFLVAGSVLMAFLLWIAWGVWSLRFIGSYVAAKKICGG